MREIALRPQSRAAVTAETLGDGPPLFHYWADLDRARGRDEADPGDTGVSTGVSQRRREASSLR